MSAPRQHTGVRRRLHRAAAGLLLLAAAAASPQAPEGAAGGAGEVELTVLETLGQRRFGYPVTTAVPLPRGAVPDPARLLLEGAGGRTAQYTVRDRWPDGSVRWLDLSFNISPGPLERQSLRLRWGPELSHPDAGAPVVSVTEEAFVIRDVYRLPRKGTHFLDSIRYGSREFLRAPAAWTVSAGAGAGVLEEAAESRRSRVLAGGPINAVVEMRGVYRGTPPVPYRLTVSQPNSKSWFDADLELEDTARQVREVTLRVPYVVERLPALWDFGVGSWLYGALRAGQAAVLEIRPESAPTGGGGPAPAWVLRGPTGNDVYAVASPAQPQAEGWGHLIDGAQGGRAVGFGTPDLAPGVPGARGLLSVDAAGDAVITWRITPRSRIRVRALYHHVADPVPVSAATSPPAMLAPLRVSLPSGWHRRCGVGPEPPAP